MEWLKTKSKSGIRKWRAIMLKLIVSAEILKNRAVSSIKSMIGNESGATAIEYGLIAALISVIIITAVTSIGKDLATKFTAVDAALK
jgi:pilus assembly protein Flp/PilA